ncbi:MAG: hypothetical protein ACREH9_04205 [Pseudomonadota bacterium]
MVVASKAIRRAERLRRAGEPLPFMTASLLFDPVRRLKERLTPEATLGNKMSGHKMRQAALPVSVY